MRSIAGGGGDERSRRCVDQRCASGCTATCRSGRFFPAASIRRSIVALMQRHSAAPVKTFTIGFPVTEYDETRYAGESAEHLGTEHHEFQVTPDAVADSARSWSGTTTNRLPTVRPFRPGTFSQLTRQHVTVALTGDGGDELFAGYPRYGPSRWPTARSVAARSGKCFGSRLWQRLPASVAAEVVWRRFKRFSEALRAAAAPALSRLDFDLQRGAAGGALRRRFSGRFADSDPAGFLDGRWREPSAATR